MDRLAALDYNRDEDLPRVLSLPQLGPLVPARVWSGSLPQR